MSDVIARPAKPSVWKAFTQPAAWTMFFFGFASGMPFLLVAGTLAYWLKDNDLDLKSITLIASAEALMAEELAPGASAWMVAGHVSTEPSCALAQRRLHLAPILDLEMRLGEGTGAVLAVPILEASGAALRDIAALADLS